MALWKAGQKVCLVNHFMFCCALLCSVVMLGSVSLHYVKQTPWPYRIISLLLLLLFLLSLQDSGRRPEELLNPAEYMSYQRVANMEPYPESQPAPAYPPVTFLPQHPYAQQPPNEPMYSNTSTFSAPAPGPRAPYTFPKEQSVWHAA